MSSLQEGPQLLLYQSQTITLDGQPEQLLDLLALDVLSTYVSDEFPQAAAGYNTGRFDGGAFVPVSLYLTNGRVAIADVGEGLSLTSIAITGGAVPGIANAVWSQLSYPVAAPSGLVALRGVISGGTVTASTSEVLFAQSIDPSSGAILPLAKIAQQGDAAPGLAGLTYAAFSDPYLDQFGNVMFLSTLSGPGVKHGNAVALFWQPNGGTAALVARAGDAAPGIAGAELATFTGAALPASFNGDEPTGPVFLATLQNAPASKAVTAATNSALWGCDTAGIPRLLARTGMISNGKKLKTIGAFLFTFDSQHQARAASDGPHVIYRATYTDQAQAIIEVNVPAATPQ
jgi:hypothetical protein